MSAISIDFKASTFNLSPGTRPKDPDRATLEIVFTAALGVIDRLGELASCVEVIKVRFSQQGFANDPDPIFEIILSVKGTKVTVNPQLSGIWSLNFKDLATLVEDRVVSQIKRKLGSLNEQYVEDATAIRNFLGQIKPSGRPPIG